MMTTENGPSLTARQQWMAVLARADRQTLEEYFERYGLPDHAIMKKPETGTVMIEGRAGGSGCRFNLGEATVTRCVVKLDGVLGFAYALGHDRRKALLAALADAMLQGERSAALQNDLIGPLAAQQLKQQSDASRKAAATKVDFFTLVRGDG